MPVSAALTWMVAPETTAPLGSVTIPEMPAATPACNRPLRLQTSVRTNKIDARNTEQEQLSRPLPTPTAVVVSWLLCGFDFIDSSWKLLPFLRAGVNFALS